MKRGHVELALWYGKRLGIRASAPVFWGAGDAAVQPASI